MFDEIVRCAKAFPKLNEYGVISFYPGSFDFGGIQPTVQTTKKLFYKILSEKGLNCQRKVFERDSMGNVTEWKYYFYYDGVYFFTLVNESEDTNNG